MTPWRAWCRRRTDRALLGTLFALVARFIRIGDVASRTFQDSTGTQWEVFEVHRASEAPRGVSKGYEGGWLAFVSSSGKRRLAPYPSSWKSAPLSELERLCESARRIAPTRLSLGGQRTPSNRGTDVPSAGTGEAPSVVRDVVRAYAREARDTRLPAIEAMVRLKTMLAERFLADGASPEIRRDATDLRRVRRWFVEAYYFEGTT
jgi:hypothetical protein